MKTKLILIALVAITFASCKKNLVDQATPVTTPSVSQFKEIKASNTFDWKSSKLIKISVDGLKTQVPITNTFKVTSKDGKDVYYNGKALMSDNFDVVVSVPTANPEIVVSFGSVNKSFSTATDKIAFDYLTPDDGL